MDFIDWSFTPIMPVLTHFSHENNNDAAGEECLCHVLLNLDVFVTVALRKSGPASYPPDMLSSADSWWEGTIEPGLRCVRCSLQHAIIQECLSSSDEGAFELECEHTHSADFLEPLALWPAAASGFHTCEWMIVSDIGFY